MSSQVIGRYVITRRAFTLRFKTYVIDWFAENDRDYRKTANYFGIKRETVYQWVANEDSIRRVVNTSTDGSAKRYRKLRKTKAKYPEIDSLVMQSIVSSGLKATLITCPMVMAFGKQLAEKLTIGDKFKASRSWAKNFIRRHKTQIVCDINQNI